MEAGLPYRKDVPCGRYDLAAPGLHLQRELTFVLFIARVFIVISDSEHSPRWRAARR